MRLGRIVNCRFFLPDVGKRFQLQSLFNERHLIADADLPTGATRDHRHGKGRVLLADIMSQCGYNGQIPFACCWIRVRGEAPGLRFN